MARSARPPDRRARRGWRRRRRHLRADVRGTRPQLVDAARRRSSPWPARSRRSASRCYKSRAYLKERQDFFTDDFDKLSLNLHKTIAVTGGVTARRHRHGRRPQGHPARASSASSAPAWCTPRIARTVNNAFWAAGLTGLYWAGISKVGQANEKIDPGYAAAAHVAAGLGQRREPVPVRGARPAGPPLRHRRHHAGPDRVGHGRAGGRAPHPGVRRVQPAAAVHLGSGRDRARGDGAHRRLRPRHHPAGLARPAPAGSTTR